MSDNIPKFEDWWMPHQVELVQDKSLSWRKETFKTTAGVWHASDTGRLLSKAEDEQELPEGANLENRAWDHEHCELCFETISDQGQFQKEGYTDGKDWVCISCYETYITPHNIKKAE